MKNIKIKKNWGHRHLKHSIRYAKIKSKIQAPNLITNIGEN